MEKNNRLKPLPKKADQVVQEQITPYYAPKPNSDTVFSRNRGNDLSQKISKDTTKNFSIGLKDIDEAIKYYFDNVIKPSVIIKGKRTPVPISYGNQELWKSIQSDGYGRDKNGKLMAPLITFKRDEVKKNRDTGNKLDGNKPHLYQVFEKKYTKQNYYDQFSVLSNRIPVKEMITTVVPDYVTVTYSCVIFTEYMEQINSIIESLNFASDSYWGDMNRFKFRAKIDSFSTLTELNVGEDRIVKSTFNLILNGYIIPEVINKELNSVNKFFTKAQVVFGIETSTSDLEDLSMNAKLKSTVLGSTSLLENSINISNNTQITNYNYGIIAQDEMIYFSTNVTLIADIVGPDNVTFNNAKILQPPSGSSIPPTSKDNFTFYANGIYMGLTVKSVTEVGNMVNVVFDTNNLGYVLETDDQITGIGKFIDLSTVGDIVQTIETESGSYLQTDNGLYLQYDA